ncbi:MULTISPECIES: Hsp20/alpha crystallin family protein [unclassified Novosphingobium]|uniref:Hsp20/alpha crystallin family protein n=1 Tax=unclassified Novosphingobium TaxID=2644732 RepID=UPI0008683A76|nr:MULTISPECIES: Hsp20/alpha crystallin family protein [unclassified Novosphingobium]MBN9143672.1 Hsp20/alpha crystallin family protein [Novosphingobium sp.]MDR6706928.1 HSP20 family protein [Novosphingobium sp. 1748]NKI99662.1 HSP20 family protein [Novosphingobium sp. SG707]ODU83583.1 MAG: hypothetical protein ABT10_04735 [Novosphingobium sp. SCN 63-17]OJX92834.1 MAG: hypothetical protein BGP00_23190 [Novosphingobium sp. 63-713]
MNEQTSVPVLGTKQAVEVKSGGPINWLRGEIDRLFDDLPFGRTMHGLLTFPNISLDTMPVTEMVEKDGGYLLSVEMPGVPEKDISIELDNDVLTISGEKKAETETKEAGYIISERSYGAFRRRFTLPRDVDPASIEARMKDGVLKLEMKKDKDADQRLRKIAIG